MSTHLELVKDEDSGGTNTVLSLIAPSLEHGVLPFNAAILRMLIPALPPAAALDRALNDLLRTGHLRCVIIGREPHLARGDLYSVATSTAVTTAEGTLDDTGLESAFSDEVASDVETERTVLYRVALVILGLGTLAIARQWLLIALT